MYPVLRTKRLNGITLLALFLVSVVVLLLTESCAGYGVAASAVIP
jgi:hypothetical protein